MFCNWVRRSDYWKRAARIIRKLENMATTQDLEQALRDLKTAIADAAQRVLDKLNNLDIPQADVDDIRTDIENLKSIAADTTGAGPATPAGGPDLASVNPGAQTREEQRAGAGPGSLPDLKKAQATDPATGERKATAPGEQEQPRTEAELPGTGGP